MCTNGDSALHSPPPQGTMPHTPCKPSPRPRTLLSGMLWHSGMRVAVALAPWGRGAVPEGKQGGGWQAAEPNTPKEQGLW